MYQALYRKWRPKTFDEVVGQQHVTETLKRQVLLNRLSHAYLFTGTRGTGKTTCAKLLARAVNCENPVGGNPCGKCQACVGIENGSILDVLEIDAASNNSVDNVRALRDDAVYTPASVRKRVYIIDEVHMLSNSAFNALLKILEEPPEHLMFILATTELHKVPATILSRCQRYSFKRVSQSDIQSRLAYIASQEGIELTGEACEMLSRMADGSLRDALSLLDQCSGSNVDKERVINVIGTADTDEIFRLFSAVKSRDGQAAMTVLDELYSDGRDVSAVLGRLAELYRDLLMSRLAPTGGCSLLKGGFMPDELHSIGAGTDVPSLIGCLDTLEDALSDLHSSSNRRISAELCLLKLCDYSPAPAAVSFAVQNPTAEAAVQAEASPAVKSEPFCKKLEDTARPQKAESAPAAEAPKRDEQEQAGSADPEHSGSIFDWTALLKVLKNRMDTYIYTIISDPEQICGEISGSLIHILAKSPFTLTLIDDPDTKSAITAAVENAAGGTWRVSVGEYKDGADSKVSKLDQLMSRFDIKDNEEDNSNG